MQIGRSQLAARDAPLAQDLKGLFWRKGKGFINEGQKKFFHNNKMKYLLSILRILIGVSIVLIFYPYATVYAIGVTIVLLAIYLSLKFSMNQLKAFGKTTLIVLGIVTIGAASYLIFVRKYCVETAPPKMGQEDPHFIQTGEKLYNCRSFLDKLTSQ